MRGQSKYIFMIKSKYLQEIQNGFFYLGFPIKWKALWLIIQKSLERLFSMMCRMHSVQSLHQIRKFKILKYEISQ